MPPKRDGKYVKKVSKSGPTQILDKNWISCRVGTVNLKHPYS